MNEKTLVALYDDAAAAYRAVDELDEAGIARERMQVVSGAADAVATGEGFNAQTGVGAVEESRGFGVPGTNLDGLVDVGVPEEDARIYADAVRRGGSLLMARLDADQVDPTLDVLARHDVAGRGRVYREAGQAGRDGGAETDLGEAATRMHDADHSAVRPARHPAQPELEQRVKRSDYD